MKKAKIMIVEDEVISAMSMETDLRNLGHEICKLVTTGEDAIKNAEQEEPDIILMDIILGGKIDGIEAAKEIHSCYDISIIFTTGCEDEETRKLAEKVGPAAFLIKPVELETIRLAIEKALKGHEKDLI